MCFSLLSVSCPGSGSLPRIVFLNVAKPWSPGIQTPLATRARRSSGVLCVDCTFPSFSEVAGEDSDLQRMDGQPLGLKAAWAMLIPSLLFKSKMRSAVSSVGSVLPDKAPWCLCGIFVIHGLWASKFPSSATISYFPFEGSPLSPSRLSWQGCRPRCSTLSWLTCGL